jgi:histidine ammonia-lyase
MTITGYLEQAKLFAQRTLIPGTESAGAGQDDVATTAFLAWSKEERAGRCADAAMAMLAMLASQALYITGRRPAAALQAFVSAIRSVVAPVDDDRILGPELGKLAEWFTQQVFDSRGDP